MPRLIIDKKNWQTPMAIGDYMASLVPKPAPDQQSSLMEPTPGAGQLVKALAKANNPNVGCTGSIFKFPQKIIYSHISAVIYTPKRDFWKMKHTDADGQQIRYDCIVMNPPFTPMEQGFKFLEACMQLTDKNIVCLLPWFILINSDRRFDIIKQWGLKAVTHLPRKAFPSSRIQCVVLEMEKGYQGQMELKYFDRKLLTKDTAK